MNNKYYLFGSIWMYDRLSMPGGRGGDYWKKKTGEGGEIASKDGKFQPPSKKRPIRKSSSYGTLPIPPPSVSVLGYIL